MVTTYSKLGDSVDDLLNNNYKALGSLALKVKSTTKDGIKLDFYAKNKNGQDNFTGGLKFTETLKKDDLSFKVEADIKEDGTLCEKTVLSGLADGLKVNFGFTALQRVETDKVALEAKAEKKKTRNACDVKLAYVANDGKCTANLKVSKKQLNEAVVDLDFAGEVNENVSVGCKISGKPLKKVTDKEKESYRQVLDTDFAVKLSTEDVTVVGALTKTGKNSSLSVVNQVCDKLSVGVEFTNESKLALPWCYKGKKPEVTEEETEAKKTWGLTAGFVLNTDNNTRLSGKLNDKGVATFAYDFDLKENLRTTFAVESNVKELGKNAKFGFNFVYSE